MYKKITSKSKYFYFSVSATLFLLLPTISVYANNPPAGGGPPAGTSFLKIRWSSPLSNITSIEGLILALLEGLIVIAIPIVVLMIIYAGFMYSTARGNAEQIKKATTALTYAIIGGILIIGAVAITDILKETICDFRVAGADGC